MLTVGEGGDRREQVLAALHRADTPVGVAQVAEQLGVHANTARFHLEALVDQGIVERLTDPPTGRGRPRISYRARPGLAKGTTRRYRLLAEILLGHLASAPEPADAARRAGSAWGAHLVPRPRPGHQVDTTEATRRLTTMLDELDFAPEPADTPPVGQDRDTPPERLSPIRLRHCPFLELAQPHRDLVCALHLGLMQGALAELGASVTVTDLQPFAEPSACLAHLGHNPRQ